MIGGILKVLALPDLVSITNALIGITAILFAFEGFFIEAAVLILVAGIFDGIDGFLARKFESSEFGVNLDSFADIISFGIAPALLVHLMLRPDFFNMSLALAAAYIICGTLRLSRFNIQKSREMYHGVPITFGGFILAFYILSDLSTPFLLILLGLLSFLMISDISYLKIRNRAGLLSLGGAIIFLILSFYFLKVPEVYIWAARGLLVAHIVYIFGGARKKNHKLN